MSRPELIIEVAHYARQRFKGTALRVWYIKQGPKSWKSIVIGTTSKVVLIRGPSRKTPDSALKALRNELEAAVSKTN